ncbi:ATP-binding cassette domain-containing protein [Halobacteriales archaeon Cl-PHB]
MAAIELRGVTKRFGSVAALKNLDLTVESGEIFGFLGPNGAGKSTAIDVMLDFVRADAGTSTVLGLDSRTDTTEIRRRTGILPDGFGVFPAMTGYEHLEFAADAADSLDDPDALLERVGLTPGEGARLAEDYSKGMAQRLTLAMALVGDPDLLILDEPTTGLDPAGARRMRQVIQEERERGATVFFSSHILQQVEAVCDRVGILRQGSLVAVDTIDGLRDAAGSVGELRLTLDGTDESVRSTLPETLRALDGVREVTLQDGTLVASCEDFAKARVVEAALDSGATVADLETRESSLEDLFVSYTEGGR